MKKYIQIVWIFYALCIIGLFFYSYTQVDLSLTLSRLSIWQTVEKAFQYVGYFQRPWSTGLYIGLLSGLFFAYICLLVLAYRNQLSRKSLWTAIILTSVLLTFSYNAFSYDLFNYIFDAKIITHYFQNPYLHKALDFTGDPMLSFMHWTDRTYPYGPVWLFVTVPLSFIGFQIFLPTFFLFKALGAISYLGTIWCVEKILKKKDSAHALLGMVIFAFSPLVIIEGLVSAHNDMVMIFLAGLGFSIFLNKKYISSFVLLLLSIGIKFATAMLLPLWLGSLFVKNQKRQWEILVYGGILLMVVPIVFASLRTNFQPWYALFLFPFIAFSKRMEIVIAFTIFSFASLTQYIPFLYTGNWDPPISFLLSIILWIGLAVSLLAGLGTFILKHSVAKPKASTVQ